MLARGALVSSAVVAGDPRHEQLRVCAFNVSKELGRCRSAKPGSHDSVMSHCDIAVSVCGKGESFWGWHRLSLWSFYDSRHDPCMLAAASARVMGGDTRRGDIP